MLKVHVQLHIVINIELFCRTSKDDPDDLSNDLVD